MRTATVLAAMALFSCVSHQKALPAISRPSSTVTSVVYKLSPDAKQTKLGTIVFDTPVGYAYGETAWGNGGCFNKEPLVNTDGRFELDVHKYGDVFASVMKRHGYPVDDAVEMFKDSKERAADLVVGARILEATVNDCYPDVFRNKLTARGSAYLKIEWSVYSLLEKKVIFTTTTEGSTYGEIFSTIGQGGILRPALADAAERLATSAPYRAVIDAPKATPTAVAASSTRIHVRRAKEFAGELKGNIEVIRKAVATVTANRGQGSGFVVSADGIVVTAEHVVSGSKFVKVNTAGGKECYGEVVASSKQRDVALVRVDCQGLVALPLATAKIVEGTEVFAIGTPLSDQLQFSVTRGVVSGFRKDEELDYIQSDVSVLPGSSGGPLLDGRGNVIGISRSGLLLKGGAPANVNFFVPVVDLSKYLPVDFD